MKSQVRRLVVLMAAGTILFLGSSAIKTPIFFNNISPSAPLGLYMRAPGRVARGSMVTIASSELPLPFDVEPFVIKQVAGVSGDFVRVDASGVYVNGKKVVDSAPLFSPYKEVNGEIEEERVLLVNPVERSYDSRYFGDVDMSKVKKVRMIWPRRN